MIDNYYAVIMAGGGGTRLWPLSRLSHPKQMLRLFGDRTLFQIALDRLQGLFPPERIIVVTVAEQAQQLQVLAPEIPESNFLLEPMAKGTASVVGLAAISIAHRDPSATMAVLTSDHFIENEPLFRQIITAAAEVAQGDYLVTLGISPTYPSIGYGYIQLGSSLGTFHGHEVSTVLRFKEKPDLAHARRFLEAGDHLWNSGMFIWRVSTILAEFGRQMPDLQMGLQRIADAWGKVDESQVVKSVWRSLKPETIDYGVMENAERVAVIGAYGLGWNDVGSWDSLFEVIPTDKDDNLILNAVNHLGLVTRNSLVYADDKARLVVTIGVDDLIIADTGDVLLICKREQAQKAREAVKRLKQLDKKQYL
jgi:mannose-1-phosphate guanylyltransferase